MDDDEEDGLPTTQEDNAIMVKQISDDLPQEAISPTDPSNQLMMMGKQNSKSRSFAEPQAAR